MVFAPEGTGTAGGRGGDPARFKGTTAGGRTTSTAGPQEPHRVCLKHPGIRVQGLLVPTGAAVWSLSLELRRWCDETVEVHG